MTRTDLLEKAISITTQDRNETYNGPEDSFKTIAAFWQIYHEARGRHSFESFDVAAMLALLKIARVAHSHGQHMDSWVDTAGYAACGAECVAPPIQTRSPFHGASLREEP